MGRITKPAKDNSRVPAASTNGKITKTKTFSKQELIERQRKAKEQANALSRLNNSPRPTNFPRESIATRTLIEPKPSTSKPSLAKPTKTKPLHVSKSSASSFSAEGFKFVTYASSLAAIKNPDAESLSDRRISLAKKKSIANRPRPSLHPLGINIFDKNTSEADKRKVYDFMKQRNQPNKIIDSVSKVRFMPIAEEGSEQPINEDNEAKQTISQYSKANSPQPAPEHKQPASILKKKLFTPYNATTSVFTVQEAGPSRKLENATVRAAVVDAVVSPIVPMSSTKSQAKTRGEKMFTPLKKPVFATDSESSSEETPDPYSSEQLETLSDEKLKDLQKKVKSILEKRRLDRSNKIPSPIMADSQGVTPVIQENRRKSTRLAGRRRSTRSCSVASTIDQTESSLIYPVTIERSVTIQEEVKENIDRSTVSLKRSVTREERRAEFRLQQERLLLNMQRREGQNSFTTTPRIRKVVVDTSFESETY